MDIEKPGAEAGKIFPVAPARFWNARYVKDPEPNEWYQRWARLQPALTENGNLRPAHNVLHVGCGNSRLCEDMYRDGYTRQTAIDFSPVVVAQQLERYGGTRTMPGVDFLVLNACHMDPLSDGRFHAVLDKALLDTLVCGDDAVARVHTYLGHALRVLKPGGTLIVVSHGEPAARLPFLTGQRAQAAYGWEVSHKHVKKESLMAEMARRGEEEWQQRLAEEKLEKEAKLEEEARAAREERALMVGGAAAATAAAARGAGTAAGADAVAVGDDDDGGKDGKLEKAKAGEKKKKKKKKRVVKREENADGTLVEVITDPRSVHYIYFCVKHKKKKDGAAPGSDSD
jgi:EEF1A lysine methyltransferase 4